MSKQGIGHILCPVDFSAQSEAALRYAASLSQKLGAALTVMHAKRYVPYTESAVALPESYVEESEKHRREVMKDLRAYIEQTFPQLQADYIIADRYPVNGILETVAEIGADLVVMATTGRSGFQRLVLGSVAEGVMRQSRVPVLTLRRSPEKTVSELTLRRILVPTNFGEPSARALEAAVMLGETYDSRLTIAYIAEPRSEDDEEALDERVREWAAQRLSEGREFDVVVRRGNSAEQIIRLAQDDSFDLVSIAAVHRPFLETTIVGTTSERVVRFSPCPVLTVPIHR